ncbi:MAG: glycine--tRNA ligase subunit beta, partial [Candidatus Atribacteria bacterium]|nr:glycine--tRNA ligase subunit beta [Candidatus Atribacteria bacterium]
MTTAESPSAVRGPSSFLLELGVEELPASDLDSAIEQLKVNVPKLLDDLHLEHGSVSVSGTPRRLAVMVDSLAPRQPDRADLVKGPPADKAFVGRVSNPTDSVGEASQAESLTYTQAAIGFAKKNGIEPSALEVRAMDGGKYVVALVKQAGRPTPEVLTESLPGLVAGIKFDKSMRWIGHGGENIRKTAFSRPIRWLICLFGETAIPFEYAGLTAGRVTRGLRPYNSPEIVIPSAEEYFNIIKKNGIVLGVEERKALIAEGVKKLAASVKGEAILPPELLAEVANLVEKPMPLLGGFEKEFLALPEDVLISVMKKHQRYFPIMRRSPAGRGDGGEGLLPYFVVVRNGDSQGIDLVRQGNEHVVRARFADANFFVREDLKHKLEDFRPRLGTLMFQKKLGSMLDKSDRMVKLAEVLAPMLGLTDSERANVKRATYLSKADLVSKMVIEMTSLQGVMGREYARRDGEAPAVAEAIGEQYQPVPPTRPGLAVALADRLDSLAGLFAAGLAPSGTKDPFGLRRAAIGVVQPLIEHEINFDLRSAVKSAAALEPVPVTDEVQAQVLEFITGRLRVVLMGMGYRYDGVDAVLAVQSDNPAGAARAVRQLAVWVARPDWSTLLPGYARCVRILRSAPTTDDRPLTVNESLLTDPAERGLYDALQSSAVHRPSSVDEFL